MIGVKVAISKNDMEIGSIHGSNDGDVVVVEFLGCESVRVRFIGTGYELQTQATHVRRGAIKDRFRPSVYGVGFLGDGDYASRTRGSKALNRYYRVWSCMLSRCYNKKDPAYDMYGGSGVAVCDDWHNLQNFAKWYEDNHPSDGLLYHLDKDCLSGDIKIYSPGTCLFLSPSENSIASSAGTYKMKNPYGEVVTIWNMNKFCKDNNLNVSAMSRVRRGLASHHKGWKRAV